MLYLLTVNYQSADLIQRLLRSLEMAAWPDWTCVIVNNSPTDQVISLLASTSVKVLEAGDNLGFGGGCNVGLEWIYARDPGAIVWLLNPDTVLPADLQPDALSRAVAFCQDYPHLAIVGTCVDEPSGLCWFGSGQFNPADGDISVQCSRPTHTGDYWETGWVTGCSMILQLANFPDCPHFDPAYFLYYEDFDFCQRYSALGMAVTDRIRVIHYPSSITDRNLDLKVQHTVYSYLLALSRYTHGSVFLYRLGRILGHALRQSGKNPQKAIAIIKGVLKYLGRRQPRD